MCQDHFLFISWFHELKDLRTDTENNALSYHEVGYQNNTEVKNTILIWK